MDGIPLLALNFGECSSLDEDASLISGYISALQSFSEEFTQSSMKSINFEDFKFHFLKEENGSNLLLVLVTDLEDDSNNANVKIKQVATLFKKRFQKELNEFKGYTSQFRKFKDLLIEMNIAQENCGGRPECSECPNHEKTSQALNAFKEDRKGFSSKLKSLFYRSKSKPN